MAIGFGSKVVRQPAEVAMSRHELVHVQGKRQKPDVTCLEGVVWVTQAGDPRDHVLLAGEHFTVGRRGRVLVGAVRDAKVRVTN